MLVRGTPLRMLFYLNRDMYEIYLRGTLSSSFMKPIGTNIESFPGESHMLKYIYEDTVIQHVTGIITQFSST